MVAATVRTIFAQPDPARPGPAPSSRRHAPENDTLPSPTCCSKPKPTSPPTPLPPATGRRSGPPTHSNGSMREIKRRADVVGSSPTTPPSSASSDPSSQNNTTNGKSPTAATSEKNQWRTSTPCSQNQPRQGGEPTTRRRLTRQHTLRDSPTYTKGRDTIAVRRFFVESDESNRLGGAKQYKGGIYFYGLCK